MREGRSVDVRKREKKHGNHCVCGTVLDRVSGGKLSVGLPEGSRIPSQCKLRLKGTCHCYPV